MGMRPREVLTLALFATCLAAGAADWPQFLGPNGDGSTPEMIRTNWSELPPRELWRKPIGPGFSSMSVVGGQLFTLVRRSSQGVDHEFCAALDAQTGDELWATQVDVANYSSLSGYDDAMDGPRSTPTVDGGLVYVFTSQLKLLCLRATDGGLVWKRDFRAELGSTVIDWQSAASPLLVGDLIFVNANASGRRLMAVRKSDGSTAWSGQDDIMTHATPVFGRIGDIPQVVFYTRSGLVAVVPESGSVLWRLGFSPSPTSTAASPVIAGDYVYATAAYSAGAWVAKMTQSGARLSASLAWYQQGNAYQCHWSTPVLRDGFLYCVASPSSVSAKLTCLDIKAGTNRWTQTTVGSKSIGFGSLIRCANALIVLTEAGEMVLVDPSPSAYHELGWVKVLKLYCWNHVTLSGGRLYARSTSSTPEIVALDVAAAPPPLPALRLAAERGGTAGAFALVVRAADGSPLNSSQAGRVEILSTTNLLLPLDQWPVLNSLLKATNDAWAVDIPFGVEPARLMRAREKSGAN
jgi:outer membrane protein assembly factor BamB